MEFPCSFVEVWESQNAQFKIYLLKFIFIELAKTKEDVAALKQENYILRQVSKERSDDGDRY